MIKIEENLYKIEITDVKEIVTKRPKDSHKGTFGTVGIIGGSLEYSGAIKLANMSATAMRSGCGITRVIVPETISTSITPYLLEQTLYPVKCDKKNHMQLEKQELLQATNNLKAIAIGMGWGRGENYQNILTNLITTYQGSLLIDADGLNTLANMNKDVLKKTNAKIILTPHLKEFSRLTNIDIEEIKKNKLKYAINFAKEYQVILLLKGETTIITDGNITYLSNSGCPGMATAGSGDVLSGIIIGILGYLKPTPFNIACSAYLAGLAGELAEEKYTDISLIASDTINYIPEAIKKIRNS